MFVNVYNLDKIFSCEVLNPENLKFESGVAIAEVRVKEAPSNRLSESINIYNTFAIIKEEMVDGNYELVDTVLRGPNRENLILSKKIKSIIRNGNYFFFEASDELSSKDEKKYFYHEYFPDLECFPIATGWWFKCEKLEIFPGEDVVILRNHAGASLYYLKKRQEIFGKCFDVNHIDEHYFLVTEHLQISNYDNYLSYTVDSNTGNRVSNVYSHNDEKFLDYPINMDMYTIKQSETAKLYDFFAKKALDNLTKKALKNISTKKEN